MLLSLPLYCGMRSKFKLLTVIASSVLIASMTLVAQQ